MSLNEAPGRPFREKWPASFDIEGIPRDREVREQKLKELRGNMDLSNLSLEQIEALREVLAQHDKKHTENVFDLSKPPKVPYVYQEFPKSLYRADGHVLTVKSEKEEQKATKGGYQSHPFPQYDYSRVDRNSRKAAKQDVPAETYPQDAIDAANQVA